jgi:hypothetical protein
MIDKARTLPVDQVFLDLEDACAPMVKPQARKNIVAALNEGGFDGKVRVVGVNDWATEWTYLDVIEVVEGAGANLDCIMLPKVQSAEQVKLGAVRPVTFDHQAFGESQDLIHQTAVLVAVGDDDGVDARIDIFDGEPEMRNACPWVRRRHPGRSSQSGNCFCRHSRGVRGLRGYRLRAPRVRVGEPERRNLWSMSRPASAGAVSSEHSTFSSLPAT